MGGKWKLALVGLIGCYAALSAYGLIAVNVTGPAGGRSVTATPGATSAARRLSGAGLPSGAATTQVSLPSRRPVASPRPLEVASVVPFGPDGTSDGDNPGVVSRVLNASAGQPWYSQWYATPEFGGLRLGTGLLLDLGRTKAVTGVRLMLGSEPGTDVQVRVGNSPSLDLPTVASAADVGGTVRLTTATPVNGRYALVWFTRLPPDGYGHYQVSVYKILVDG